MAAIAAEDTRLIEAVDAHFAWMLGEIPAPFPNLRLPPGGVDSHGIIRLLRDMTARMRKEGCHGSWLIVAGDEVVGLCSYKQPPSNDGKVEIGYGIAAGKRDRGYASRAVRAMLEHARRYHTISVVVAATASANIVSQRVLERNGFSRTCVSYDPDDGELIWWQSILREF